MVRAAIALLWLLLSASYVLAETDADRVINRAEQGNADAQAQVGIALLSGIMQYQDGSKLEKDLAAAEKWLLKAAEQRHRGAHYVLGKMYFDGECKMRDYWQAAKWLEEYEKEIASDEQSALPSQRRLIERLSGEVYYILGQIYYQEDHPADPVPFNFCDRKGLLLSALQNYAKARAWYTKAADRGNKDAAYQLAGMYDAGRGVPQDYSEAARWYERAVEFGHAAAPRELGKLHAKLGDPVAAHMWFNVGGDAKARDEVARFLTSDQLLRAQKMATEWARRKESAR